HEASELLRSRHLNSGERSGCCLVLARVESTAGRTDSSITWLQRAVSLAQQEHDHDRMCWAKLRLLTRVAEHSGFAAASVLLRDLRMSAMQTGDPAILAAVHLYVAQTEAKRGLLASPRKHVHLALTHLKASPNVWLEAMVSHIETAIAIIGVDFTSALVHATRAVELAEQSGVADMITACVGTLAHVHSVTGDFASAVRLLEWSERHTVPGSDNHLAALDSLARICLLENKLEECNRFLLRIDELTDPSRSSLRYVH